MDHDMSAQHGNKDTAKHWRTARRLLIAFACLATLTAVFHTVENWRGKRTLEKVMRELESKGEELNWNALIPKPPPDDQNIFKATSMSEWFVRRGGKSTAQAAALSQRLVNTNFPSVITETNVAADYLRWSSGFAPEFAVIRKALERPHASIEDSYQQPFEMGIPEFVVIRNIAQTLEKRARCCFVLGKSDQALDELTFMLELRRLLEGRPLTLVSAMINVAVTGLYLDVVGDGIRSKKWSESHMTTLKQQMLQIHMTPLIPEAMRMERAAVVHSWQNSPERLLRLNEKSPRSWKEFFKPVNLLLRFAPRGWFHQNQAVYMSHMTVGIEVYDSRGDVMHPAKLRSALEDIQKMQRQYFKPFSILSMVGIPNHIKASQTAARNQTKANLTLLAVALEQYRKGHGQYPTNLDQMIPQFVERIPNDIINGQPLKYRRTDDRSYILYSIGWNEKDDGGVRKSENGEYEQGDWVW
jgi:hypothetical protein